MKTPMCQYASHCPRRMRDGDRFDGCSAVDLRTCSPVITRSAPAAPPAPEKSASPYCRRCQAPVKATGWRIVRRLSPRCRCGSREICYDEVA